MPATEQTPSHERRESATSLLSSSSSSTTPALSHSPAAAPDTTRFPHPRSRNSRDASRRLSEGVPRASGIAGEWRHLTSNPMDYLRTKWAQYLKMNDRFIAWFWSLTLVGRIAVIFVILSGWAIIIASIFFTEKLFDWLASVSKTWRQLPAGWLIAFLLIFVSAFPPVIGYSTACTVAGFVYGFPMGWPIAAAGCILGSLAAFMLCRTTLGRHVEGLIGADKRFVALGQVLRRDGLLYLTGIRFCPLPFSLSNGFLATIPSISPLSFAISTALSSPKLLIHIFIGSRLAIIAEGGNAMSFRDKFINYLSMIIGSVVGTLVGYIIYRRTMARAKELAREESLQAAEEGDGGYEDTDDTLMDPEDAANVMGDDDVSLWETQVDDRWDDEDDDGNNYEDDDAKKTRKHSD